jgi:hypothetical protein
MATRSSVTTVSDLHVSIIEPNLDYELYPIVRGSANISPAFSAGRQRQQVELVLSRIGKQASLYVSRVGLG